MPDTRLRITRWKLAQQERLIADQRTLISRLRAGGLPTDDAENLLRQMCDVLAYREQSMSDQERPPERHQLH